MMAPKRVLASLALLLDITAHLYAYRTTRLKEGGNEGSFAKVDGRRMVEQFKHNNTDGNARARNSSLFVRSSQDGPKRPCKRLFTSIDGERTLAQVNRDSGKTNVINSYDKPFVNSMEYDFLTDTILGIVNGTVLANIGHKQAHVRLVGETGADFISAMAVSSYGEVFAYSPVDTSIYVLDKFTGDATSLGETGLSNLIDMAYWFQADLVFATDGASLFVIDIINRALGEIGNLGQGVQSIVITPQGTLFAVTDEEENASIWEHDKFTGEIVQTRDPVSSSLPSGVVGGTLRCPFQRLPPNAFPPREPTPSPDAFPPTPFPTFGTGSPTAGTMSPTSGTGTPTGGTGSPTPGTGSPTPGTENPTSGVDNPGFFGTDISPSGNPTS